MRLIGCSAIREKTFRRARSASSNARRKRSFSAFSASISRSSRAIFSALFSSATSLEG